MANTRATIGDQATVDGLVNRSLTSLEENGVTSLPEYALYKSTGLTSVKFPNLIEAGEYAFSNCTSLEGFDETAFPSLTTLNEYVFQNCTSLVNVAFSSLTKFVLRGFANCNNLEKIDLKSPNLRVNFFGTEDSIPKLNALIIRSNQKSTMGNTVGLPNTAIGRKMGAVYVPSNLVDTYKADNYWNKYIITSIDNYPLTDFSTISDSWSEIFANEENGTYSTKYKVGDTKLLDLGTEGKVYMQIVGFNKDDKADESGKAKITWIALNLLNTTKQMNSTNTNDGGWGASELRSYLKNTIKPLIPQTVREAIVDVTKTTGVYKNDTYVDENEPTTYIKNGQITTDDIWIPSLYEILGSKDSETVSPLYNFTTSQTATLSSYKYLGETLWGWWLRSPYNLKNTINKSNKFEYINNTGSRQNNVNPTHLLGVAIGFCT